MPQIHVLVLDDHAKSRTFLWAKVMDIPIDARTLDILVALLFLLISFLINLLQRRHSRTRLDRTGEGSGGFTGCHLY